MRVPVIGGDTPGWFLPNPRRGLEQVSFIEPIDGNGGMPLDSSTDEVLLSDGQHQVSVTRPISNSAGVAGGVERIMSAVEFNNTYVTDWTGPRRW
jgi:hypothetical protein